MDPLKSAIWTSPSFSETSKRGLLFDMVDLSSQFVIWQNEPLDFALLTSALLIWEEVVDHARSSARVWVECLEASGYLTFGETVYAKWKSSELQDSERYA